MKRITAFAVATLSATASLCAQGLVNFANDANTPVYVQEPDSTGPYSIMSATAGSFSFGLFLGRPNTTWFFTGVYATNTGVNGLLSGGIAAVPGWAAGTSTNYFVAGWSGTGAFEGQWLDGNGIPGNFGVSGIGNATAGNGSSIPTLNLFDGGPGTLQFGLQLGNHLVPEPSAAAIGAVGIGLVLLQRVREKKRNDQLMTK